MKSRFFIIAAICASFVAASCTEEVTSEPKVAITSSLALNFEKGIGTADVTFEATRNWYFKAVDATDGAGTENVEWIAFSASSGEGFEGERTEKITVLPNQGPDREALITLYITNGWGYIKSESVKVSQSGSGASVLYSNNFDKTKAAKDASDRWPEISMSIDCWQNAKGASAEGVKYAKDGVVSPRSTSPISNEESKSLYNGSGVNKIFLGSGTPAFSILDVDLAGATNLSLSFGGARSVYNTTPGDGKSKFEASKFHVYVSADKSKWVEVSYSFASGSMPDGQWDLATADFTVPSGTAAISICFRSDEASTYSIDDVALRVKSEAANTLDFNSGTTVSYGTAL